MGKRSRSLVILFILGIIILSCSGLLLSLNEVQNDAFAESGVVPDSIELIYFHRTERCPSCINAEQYARDTLETYFKDDVSSGRLSIKSIDYQVEKELASQYNVKMQGLKLRIITGGKEAIKDVPEVWALVKDKTAYMSYLKRVLDKELGK